MSRLLGVLLGAREPLFSVSLQQLEEATARSGVDVKLTAEIIYQVQTKTKLLGLDPNDTTPQELYHSLINVIAGHDASLSAQLGTRNCRTVADMLPIITKTIEGLDVHRSCWVIKKSVAKRLLKKSPPPELMKILNYKSVDSMLKRENILELYCALRVTESSEWKNRFIRSYSTLKPADFETRTI